MKTARRIESFVHFGIIALALYLVAASVIVYVQLGRLRSAQDWVEHTQDVRYAIQDTLSLFFDAESSQRAYMIGKDNLLLMNYFAAVTKLNTSIKDVVTLTLDNPAQHDRAKELEQLIAQKTEQLKANINYAMGTDTATAQENYRTGIARATANDIRNVVDNMLEEEDRLFDMRTAEVKETVKFATISFVALLVLFIGVAASYFVSASRNIAAHNKMLQDLMEANAKAERANHFKGDLLNYLGRALYEPLRNMAGFSDLLLYRTTDALTEKDQKIVTDIRANTRFLLSLAANFLHIGRLQAGKALQIEDDDCDLVDIINDVLGIVAPSAAKAGVRVRHTLPFGRALIRCDKEKLSQILLNLLDNAVKHSPRGGTIDLSITRTDNGDLIFTIQDTGPGIAPDRLRQVMIPFAQIDSMFVREEQGIGLGLPMALGFAQAHGGTLELTSSEHGTKAVFSVPANRVIRIFEAPPTAK